MDPQIVLSRGYWEYADDCRDQWIAAYKEIGRKSVGLGVQARKMIQRMELACSLTTTHAIFFNSGNVDDCFIGEAVERENNFLERNQKAYDSLDGDFPCGNAEDMRFARRFFSIREMAYLQMGLATSIDPDDLSEMPPVDKPFADEAFPMKITEADQPWGRKGFVHECLGRYAEAIECYEAFKQNRPEDRIKRLREQLSNG